MSRLGDVQTYVLMMTLKGLHNFEDIVRLLNKFGIPKSSIYSAIDELAKKGIVKKIVDESGRRIIIAPGPKIHEIIEPLKNLIKRKILEALFTLTLIEIPELKFDEFDPEELSKLRDILEQLITHIDQVLSKWKKIEVQ